MSEVSTLSFINQSVLIMRVNLHGHMIDGMIQI